MSSSSNSTLHPDVRVESSNRRGKKPALRLLAASALIWMASLAISGPAAAQANRLERVDASSLPGDQVEVRLQLSNPATQPLAFTVDNPALISFDLPGTSIAMASRRVDVKKGVLDTINTAEANGRTRVVMNVDRLLPYETRVDGNTIIVTLAAAPAARVEPSSSPALSQAAGRTTNAGSRSVTKVDFRRGTEGSGRVVVELTDPRANVDLRQEGGRIVVNFNGAAIADSLLRRLDVVDFATPVSSIDTLRVGDGTRVVIAATGDYEQIAYQTDNFYTIEVKPVTKLPPGLELQKEYKGE